MVQLVIVIGIILMLIGVKKVNQTIRNIGIIVAVVGCALSVILPKL